MRELTFRGYLKQYVSHLSGSHTDSMYHLVHESVSGNLRLREPLFLYALMSDRTHILLAASKGTSCESLFYDWIQHFDRDSLLQKLSNDDTEIPHEFRKFWKSYQTEKMRSTHDANVKKLFRKRILDLKESNPVSTYRLCKDLGLNNANVCTWLRTGKPGLVTVDAARKMMQYLEMQASSAEQSTGSSSEDYSLS